jgi:hypothetical protein
MSETRTNLQARIGKLPDTLADRSVAVSLKRRLPRIKPLHAKTV